MNNNSYIIPANANNGKLIFNLFTKFDLIIVLVGFSISIISLLLFVQSFQGLIISLLPLLISAALVIPIPNYHNVYIVLKELIEFFYKRRNYKWEGWCVKDEFK